MVTVTGKGPYPKEKTSVLDCVNDSNLSALFSGTEDSTLSDVRTVGDSKWRWEFPRRTTHPGKQTWNVKMDPLKIQDLGFGGFGNHCCTSLLSRNILYINTLILERGRPCTRAISIENTIFQKVH